MTSPGSRPTGRAPSESASVSTTIERSPGADEATRLLKQSRPREAAAAARRTLVREPRNADALYLLAVAQRYLKQPGEALATLVRLQEQRPGYARAFQEAGHDYLALGLVDDARRAFRKAVMLNPALVASWSKLKNIALQRGDRSAAQVADEQIGRLKMLPRELLSATSMLHEGRLYRAERLCRAFLQKNPRHVEGMRLLADLGVRLQVLDDAEFLLESALEFEPNNLAARLDYVNVLHKRQKYAQALEQAADLRQRVPGRPAFELAYASESLAVGDYDTALAVYDEMLAAHPRMAGTYLVRGHALKTVGRFDDAVEAYRGAIRIRPDFGDAWWSLANLKTYVFEDAELREMQQQEARPEIRLADRYQLCFALGKAHEDRASYEASFACYERGNALKHEEIRYSAERTEQDFAAQQHVCTREFFEQRSGVGCPDPDPIFIVGLPRAGSTLLEQILASHSQVDGTMELPNILALVHKLSGRLRVGEESRYPEILGDLDADRLRRFGEQYIEDTRIYRAGAPFFIDKMPNNFRHIGLIHLMLPNAKIIDARRHPMACCFSGFKQLFAQGQEFTYGLEEVGRYYRAYVELMDHWDRVLPGKVLRVGYEQVVDDLEVQVHRILDFCGLGFEERCISFHETERPVRTPSSEQVRQPIYASGKEQWQHFEPFLDPLRSALGPVLESPAKS
jgi:tetratricopeptide (TPR) repeat protein